MLVQGEGGDKRSILGYTVLVNALGTLCTYTLSEALCIV